MRTNNDVQGKVKAFLKLALLFNFFLLVNSGVAKASDFMSDINQIKQEMLHTNAEEKYAPQAIFASNENMASDSDDMYAQRRRRTRSRNGQGLRRRVTVRQGRGINRPNSRRQGRRFVGRNGQKNRGSYRRGRRSGSIQLICNCKRKIRKNARFRNSTRRNSWR